MTMQELLSLTDFEATGLKMEKADEIV